MIPAGHIFPPKWPEGKHKKPFAALSYEFVLALLDSGY